MTQVFFGVGSRVTHGAVQAQMIRAGEFRMSYLVHLSMAICSCGSIRIYSDESHGIPKIMGNGNPLFTFYVPPISMFLVPTVTLVLFTPHN